VFLTIYICTSNLLLLFDNTTGMTHLKILLFTLHDVMCTQICMKTDPKKVSEDQRLTRKFACSEIFGKIGAGKNLLKTNHLPCKLAFQ